PPLPHIIELLERVWAFRAFGGALDACMLAAGKIDVWLEPKVEPWDVAPLRLILEESGAAYFALDGSRAIDRGNAVGCAPRMTALVKDAFGVPRGAATE